MLWDTPHFSAYSLNPARQVPKSGIPYNDKNMSDSNLNRPIQF